MPLNFKKIKLVVWPEHWIRHSETLFIPKTRSIELMKKFIHIYDGVRRVSGLRVRRDHAVSVDDLIHIYLYILLCEVFYGDCGVPSYVIPRPGVPRHISLLYGRYILYIGARFVRSSMFEGML